VGKLKSHHFGPPLGKFWKNPVVVSPWKKSFRCFSLRMFAPHICGCKSSPQRKWPMLRQQSQKCTSLAAMFYFTSYKSTWLTQWGVLVSLHYLPQMSSTVTCG